MVKVNNKNNRDINDVVILFNVNFEHISHVLLV